MNAAGALRLSDPFRAIGLQSSTSAVVPIAIAITGVALWFAARSSVRDAARAGGSAAPLAAPIVPSVSLAAAKA